MSDQPLTPVGVGARAPMRAEASRAPRYLTQDIPGVGGRIRERPEDFLVDEIPAYEPCGSGEHLYLLIQKRSMSTLEMIEVVARHFGVRRLDVGIAGLKDKHAITRQVVSVHTPGRKLEEFPSLTHPNLEVLWADVHTNKLRPGHLKGNRFSIRIRGVEFSRVRDAKRVLDCLEREGVPNRVGEQRFGLLGNNHEIGAALVAAEHERAISLLLGPCEARPGVNAEARRAYAEGRFDEAMALFPRAARAERAALRELSRGRSAKQAVRAIDRSLQSFYVSAFQSAAFNAVLDARLRAGDYSRVVPGDLAFKHDNGAVFAVDESVASDPTTLERVAQLNVSPSGPMWGPRMTRASGMVDAAEVAALAGLGVSLDQVMEFGRHSPHLVEGKRRPLRVPLTSTDIEAGVDEHGPFIRVVFDLPRGAFATAVLPEIMKNEPELGPGAAPITEENLDDEQG